MEATGGTMKKTAALEVREQWERRREDFTLLVSATRGEQGPSPELSALGVEGEDTNEVTEDAQERITEYPLGVTIKTVVRVDLSTGGPGDWLEAILDDNKRPERITYHFAPWFDHAELTLEGEDFDVAEAFIDACYPLDTIES